MSRDADGNRIARRDGTTIYLPGMELHSNGKTNVTATRYYSHAGISRDALCWPVQLGREKAEAPA